MPPTTDVPILLLDVDGVLNAARLDLPDGWQRGTFNGFVLSWDPTVTARLRELHESGRVEIQWLTTWTTNADRLLAEPMGLPRGLKTHAPVDMAPTGFLGPLGGRSGWWKLVAAREGAEAEPDRRLARPRRGSRAGGWCGSTTIWPCRRPRPASGSPPTRTCWWSPPTCSSASPISNSTRSRRGCDGHRRHLTPSGAGTPPRVWDHFGGAEAITRRRWLVTPVGDAGPVRKRGPRPRLPRPCRAVP